MELFQDFSGIITMIDNFWPGYPGKEGCTKLITVQNDDGNIVNFVVTPSTYFINHAMVNEGDLVIGFYDANAPAPLIFPPQLQAIVMSIDTPNQNVKVDYFDDDLVSSDNTLKLNISPSTEIELENGQKFYGSLQNRNLIVLYGASTKSIPAQTVPYKVIVMC